MIFFFPLTIFAKVSCHAFFLLLFLWHLYQIAWKRTKLYETLTIQQAPWLTHRDTATKSRTQKMSCRQFLFTLNVLKVVCNLWKFFPCSIVHRLESFTPLDENPRFWKQFCFFWDQCISREKSYPKIFGWMGLSLRYLCCFIFR